MNATPDWLELLETPSRERLAEQSIPESISPMLATLTDDYFTDPAWIFERKLDGERALAFVLDGDVTLLSRNDRNLANTYPEIAEAFDGRGPGDLIVDGEIVAFDGNVTSFARLQSRMQIDDRQRARASGTAVYYYLFDIVYLDGYDLMWRTAA